MKQFLATFALIFFTILFYWATLLITPNDIEEEYFRIKRGESAGSIARRLAQADIICSEKIFYYYTRLTNSAGQLSYGLYKFDGKINITDVLEKIKQGKVQLKKITIPEGMSIAKTITKLTEKNFGSRDNFMKLSYDSDFIKQLTGFNLTSLEGFLYPETYYFPETATEEYVLKTMVEMYFSQTKELDFISYYNLDYYQIITLASIVEMEARIQNEKPLIASVYLNRLEVGMKLQADPTVSYILAQKGKKRKKIYYKDLKIESPYNTYLYEGLPPTPICSPSKSAIEAVLKPTNSDYFFFFASGGGKHSFSQTYSQHLSKQKVINN